MLMWTIPLGRLQAFFFFFFGIVFIFTKLNYHLFRTWSWRRGEGRDDAEGYLPDKLLGDTKAWLIAKCEARQTGRTLSSYMRCESGLISRTARIQMIDSTSSMVWLGVSDEDDVVCGGGEGLGVKNGWCWWDDKASPWMPLMGEGGPWPSSVPPSVVLMGRNQRHLLPIPSHPTPPPPPTASPQMQTLCCPLR